MTGPESLRSALLLSNRLTDVGVPPLRAREFWGLLERVGSAGGALDELAGDGALLDAVATDDVSADRLSSLLDATRAVAFEIERLAESGIELVSALDERFPGLLRSRLGHGCPPHVFVAGGAGGERWAGVGSGRSLAIVGESDAGPRAHEHARAAVAAAVVAGWNVITPTPTPAPAPSSRDTTVPSLAQSVVDEAVACEASIVSIADAGINQVARRPDLRRLVQAEHLCLLSPFAPDDLTSAALTRARDRIVQAAADLTLVVSCHDGTGPVWASVVEPVSEQPESVVTIVDTAPSSPPGNRALAALGAHELTSVDELHRLLS